MTAIGFALLLASSPVLLLLYLSDSDSDWLVTISLIAFIIGFFALALGLTVWLWRVAP